MREVDVAVLGGGLAGLLVARQLRREVPAASVLVVERTTTSSWKVGESTVDVAGNYLARRQGLSTYLLEHHLPKNGLRFFFDREDGSAPLDAASEIGTSRIPPFPAFQIDRARFEDDLRRALPELGAEVRLGTRARGVELGAGGEPHAIHLEDAESGAAHAPVHARWVVDATGRASLLARQEKLRVPVELPHASVWGRFRHVRDIDDFGSPEFRGRMRWAPRRLSTTHFCFPGGWIWHIPLGRGVVSVGVVMEARLFRGELRSEGGFLAFLRARRAVAQLLEGAELLDVMSFGQLAHGTRRFYDGARRFALVGEAAAFADPFYSPGSDFIAIENDQVTDLVRRDLGGAPGAALAERAEAYDRYVAARFESAILLYQGQYGTLGSYDLFATKWDFDVVSYLDRWLQPYLLDHHLDLGEVRRELEAAPVARALIRTFRATLLDAEGRLRAEGRYFAHNTGCAIADPVTRLLDPEFGTEPHLRRSLPRLKAWIATLVGELGRKVGARSRGPLSFAHMTMERSLL